MRARYKSFALPSLLGLLVGLALSGCGSGGEANAGNRSPEGQAREYVDHVRSEEGDEWVREHAEAHRQEIEEAQTEWEEDPNQEVAQEAQAEGAEARETIENEEAEDEAEAEGPEPVEHERGEGRLLRED